MAVILKPRRPTLNREHPHAKGLVFACPFFEGGGTLARELAGNQNNLTSQNGATWAKGQTGWAASLDGTDDYFDNQAPIGLPTGNAARVVSLWVNPTNINPGGAMVSWGGTSGNMFGLLMFQFGGTQYLYTDGVSTNITTSGAGVLTPGVWSHVVFANDGASYAYFVNGVLIQTGSLTPNTGTVTKIRIGERTDATSQPFPGQISDVRIYNRVFNIHDAVSLYEDPWGLYKSAEFVVPGPRPTSATATASSYFPTNGSTDVELDIAAPSVVWTPIDSVGNPLNTSLFTMTANGTTLSTTSASVGGGAYRVTASNWTYIPGRSYTMTSTATTTDGNTNLPVTWSFSARDVASAGIGLVNSEVSTAQFPSGLIDLSVVGGGYASTIVEFAAQLTGIQINSPGLLDTVVLPGISHLSYNPGLVQFVVTKSYDILGGIFSADVGTGGEATHPFSTDVHGDVEKVHPFTVTIANPDLFNTFPFSTDITNAQEKTHPWTANIGTPNNTTITWSADIAGIVGFLILIAALRSEGYADAEDNQ